MRKQGTILNNYFNRAFLSLNKEFFPNLLDFRQTFFKSPQRVADQKKREDYFTSLSPFPSSIS